jgi:hypothetical protein
MTHSTYFNQECPICGRQLHIRVEYLGRRVVCQHCQGALIATDPVLRRHSKHYVTPMMRCADELLATIEERQWPNRLHHPR